MNSTTRKLATRIGAAVMCGCCLLLLTSASHALDIHWNGSGGPFSINPTSWQNVDNWDPAGSPFVVHRVPNFNDTAVLSDASHGTSVNLSGHVLVGGVAVGGGIDLDPAGYFLDVEEDVTISGVGSSLLVPEETHGFSGAALRSDNFVLLAGGSMQLGGFSAEPGVARIRSDESKIGAGSVLSGNGLIDFMRRSIGAPNTVLQNDGTIRPLYGQMTMFVDSQGGGLPDNVLDLDGMSENGILDIDDGNFISTAVKLRIRAKLSDAFDGTIQIGQDDTLEMNSSWQLGSNGSSGSGLLEMNGGNGIATLSDEFVTVRGTNTRINILTGTANFDAEMNLAEGRMNVSSNTTVHFARSADFANNFTFQSGPGYDLIVDDAVTFRQTSIDWDSTSSGGHTTTINPGGALQFLTNEINPGNNAFLGHVTINGGLLRVDTTNPWILNGQMNLNHVPDEATVVTGSQFVVGNGADLGADSLIRVGGGGTSAISAPVRFRSDAEVEIAMDSQLLLTNQAIFEAGAEVIGPGTLFNLGSLSTDEGAAINTKLENAGNLIIGGTDGIGALLVDGFEQTASISRIKLELAGELPIEFDRIMVSGTAELAGILEVDWLGDDPLERGNQFSILAASNVTGTFDTTLLPSLDPGDAWNIQYSPTSVLLKVIADIEADLDNDGDVDGADFLAIQRTNPALIPLWESQFGIGAPLEASQAIPEPQSLALLLLALTCVSRRYLFVQHDIN